MTEIKKFLRPKPMVLITLEGWGVAPAHSANAISEADPKYFKYIISHYPALTLHATGKSVGSLLTVSVGTELGHTALGLGRPVVNYCSLIDQEIVSGNFEKSLKPLFVTMHTGAVHVVGLISTVQLEASVEHLQALLLVLKEVLPQGRKIFLHAILDGRDMSAKGTV
jgi:2,3-bisphosphoglycerate-independent phosphoglycerate mutase